MRQSSPPNFTVGKRGYHLAVASTQEARQKGLGCTWSCPCTSGRRFPAAAGTPGYGPSGMFGDPDGGGTHGLNERIRVRSLYEGRDFLHSVVKLYANQR